MSNPFLNILKPTPENPTPNPGSGEVLSKANPNNISEEEYNKKKIKEVAGEVASKITDPLGFIPDNSTAGIVKNTITGLPKAGVNVFKDILQGIARSVGTVGVTAGNIPTQIANEITGENTPLPFEGETPTDQNKFTSILFGGRPIRTVQNATENVKKITEPYIGEKAASLTSLPLVIGGLALDLSGWGGKAGVKTLGEVPESFFRYVAKEKSPAAIEETLKKIGLDDINSSNLAKELAPTRTVDEAKDILVAFGQPKGETNAFKNILKAPEKAPGEPIIPKTNNLLPQEVKAPVEAIPATPEPITPAVTPNENSLVAVHNLSDRKLAFADRLGGLANPSMAVVDPKITPFENYGEISLIPDPKLLQGEKTHLADAYSPRFPSVHSTMAWDDYKQLEKDFQPYVDKIGKDARKIEHDDTEMIRNIENNPAVALKFLEEKGIKPSPEGQHYFHSQIQEQNLDGEFQTFLNKLYEKYNLKERMFAGYTPSGQRRYKDLSIYEASKIMGKQKEEGMNYGLGSYRSKIAPVVRNLSTIKKQAKRLVSKEDFEVIKDEYWKELSNLQDKLSKYAKVYDSNSFSESANQLDTIGSVLSGEKGSMYYFNNKFPNAPQSIIDDVIAFREKLKNMPTEYFETKFRRPVYLHEFKKALIPEGSSKETIDILKRHGIEIKTYKKGEKGKAMTDLLSTDSAFSRPILPGNRMPVTPEVARKAILDGIGKAGYTEKDLKILFTDEAINGNSLGTFEKENRWLGDVISLYEDKGKVGLITALHESKHFLFSKLPEALQKEMLEQAKKDIGPMYKGILNKGYKKKGIYSGTTRENAILEEFIVERWAKYDAAKEHGYQQSVYGKVFEALDNILKKIIETYKKIKAHWKSLPNKQGGFAANPFARKISEADRLIAEGKIRVVSRDGKDVYQIKKGKEWVNTQGEDSAVRQVTRSIPEGPKLPKNLEDGKTYLEIRKEQIDLNPAKQLEKYYDPKLGGLPEVGTNKGVAFGGRKIVSKWKREGDVIAANLGYENSEAAREAFDVFLKEKKAYREDLKAFNAEKRNYLETKKVADALPETPKPAPLKIEQLDTTTGEGRSLEILASQAQAILDDINYPNGYSLPGIIEQTMTPVKNKVHVIDTFLRTPRSVMEKIGFGKEWQMLRDGSDQYWKDLPKEIAKVDGWLKKLKTKEAQVAVYRWLDGKPVTLGPAEKEVALDIKDYLAEWAKKLKLEKDEKITHYITHIFSKEIVEKEFDEELAKIITDKIPGETYDPFLLERLGKKGYIEDLGLSLDAYIKRAVRKVNMDPALDAVRAKAGVQLEFSNIEKSQFQYVQKYINNIQMRPSDFEESVDNFIKSIPIIGYKFGQRPVINILSKFRTATFRGMIGGNLSSALRNLSQGINTYATLGEKYTTLGYINIFKKGAVEELEKEGILNAGFVQDRVLSSGKKFMQKLDNVLFYAFNKVEQLNRGAAYFGAKSKALAEGKTEEEAIKYGKEIVAKTQFLFDAIDTPVGMGGVIPKTLLQFQTYTTKQLEFLATINKGKGFKGTDRLKYAVPYLRYIAAGLAFIYTIGQAFGMKPKELLPWFRFDTPPSLKFPAEIAKALANTPDKYNQPRDWSKKLKDIGNAGIGLIPAGSQIKKTFQGIKTVKEGGSFDSAGKLQFPQGQSWTEKAQSILFGKYASNEAQNYFNKSEINSEEMKKVQPIYDRVQELVKNGDEISAQNIIDTMTDDEYALYKKYKTAATAAATIAGKKAIIPVYQEIQKLKTTDPEAAKAKLDALSDDEYKYYSLVKKQMEKDQKASEGVKPTYENGSAESESGVINTILTYAKAIGTDPVTAFNRIFTGQRIRRIDNGAIIVERMPFVASTKVKIDRGATANMKLDHTVPLELGGSNAESNLKLVDTAVWSSYTPVENYLAGKLKSGELSRKEVQKLIVDFKNGKITTAEIYGK